jgi:hypothetical protein
MYVCSYRQYWLALSHKAMEMLNVELALRVYRQLGDAGMSFMCIYLDNYLRIYMHKISHIYISYSYMYVYAYCYIHIQTYTYMYILTYIQIYAYI